MDTDLHSAISYPFLSMETCDFEHLIRDGRFERRSKARNCDGFEESNDDKGEFYSDDLGDRCYYENYSSTSCLNSTSLFRSDYAGVGKGVGEFSPCGQSINDITPVRYGDFPEETFSPCMDRRGRDYRSSPSACRIASDREVKMDVQRYQALEAEHIAGKKLGTIHHSCSPDGRLSGRCDDTFGDETFSPCLDLKRKLNTHGLSVLCVSPISVDEGPEIDFQRCQVPEPNCSFPEQSGICCTRLRSSHSAPPLYRGKRRFVSVMNCLLSTAESPAVQTTPQVCNMTGFASCKSSFFGLVSIVILK